MYRSTVPVHRDLLELYLFQIQIKRYIKPRDKLAAVIPNRIKYAEGSLLKIIEPSYWLPLNNN